MADGDLERQPELIAADLKHRQLQIRAEQLTIALRGMIAVVALVVVGSFGVLVWHAANSRGIVIETFHVPPALEAQGLTGEVVAAQILDRLTDMRSRTTGSSRAAEALESGWRDDYRVAIPQTGISIGDVRTALRRWLGDETRVGGEVYLTGQGLALTVRTNRESSATFKGAAGEVETLALRAAEDIYHKTSPYLFSVFLNGSGRTDEAIAVRREVADTHRDPRERAWALSGLGDIYTELGRCADAVLVLERAIRLDPNLPNAVANLGISHGCFGHDQVQLDSIRRAIAIIRSGRASGQDLSRGSWLGLEPWIAEQLGDFRLQLRLLRQREMEGENTLLPQADSLARMKDVRASMRLLSRFRPQAWTNNDRRSYWITHYNQAAALDDWSAAARFAAHASAACARLGPGCTAYYPVQDRPFQAAALARAGDRTAAEAMARDMPRDCYKCAWARAIVAEMGGDSRRADYWFAHAARLGPRLPLALADWAQARLGRGDAAGALPLFEQVLRFAPENAQSHKGRADALARLGRGREALSAYAAAAERAPRWGALHLDWGIALWQAGRRDRAREQWRAAAGMDLSRRDRARLQRIWDRTNAGAS